MVLIKDIFYLQGKILNHQDGFGEDNSHRWKRPFNGKTGFSYCKEFIARSKNCGCEMRTNLH